MEWKVTTNSNHISNVQDLCKQVIPYFVSTFFSRYVKDYKLYLWYKWDRAKQIQDWQTNINMPLVPAIVDTMYSSMYDSKMRFHITEPWETNVKTSPKHALLNKSFDYNSNGRESLLNATKEAIITGKWFVQPYFNSYTEKIIINWKNYGKTNKRPELAYVSVFDVFYDYNTTIEDSPFFIKRHVLSRKNILKRYLSKVKKYYDWNEEKWIAYIDSIINQSKARWCRYSDFDFNRVRNILAYEDLIVNEKKDTDVAYMWVTVWDRSKQEQSTRINTWVWVGSIDHLNNIFGIDFESNKVYEVIEYTDDNYHTVMIDGVELFTKKQENILNKIYDISFNRIPGTSDSTGISSNIGDLNIMINTLQNIFLDGLKMNTSPMYEQVGWLNQMLWGKNKVVYEPFKIIPTQTAGWLKKIEMWLWGFEPVNAVQFLEWMAEKRVWVNEYIIWWQGKVERVAGWVDLIYNQYKSKLLPLTNSINKVMWRIAKAFLVMYAQYYTKDELTKLWFDEDINIEEIINEDNINFQLTSLALLEKEEWIKYLMDNLGAISNFGSSPDGQVISPAEIVKAILTKEVDIDKIVVKEQPQQMNQGWNQWQPNQSWWLMSMINNLPANQ